MSFLDFLKTTYSKESLINICKNDRRILHDEMLKKAKVYSRKTVDFFWNMERTGTCTIKEVTDGIYCVTINGSVDGLDDFGHITDTFLYTKTIYVDKYGDLNTAVGVSNVTVKKKI